MRYLEHECDGDKHENGGEAPDDAFVGLLPIDVEDDWLPERIDRFQQFLS